ncbi:hypothetical protein TH63_03345 [Rufibacter radiotolerans]|uniref:CAAX prenyl protease 2/Lysostaphin resistance protein A-like domain-containing protein n=1 Tax=Rufibacter radiotolerans TaxID=1379910 RepID=A0A0H4VM92_9BACT|nr:type II CAAX endopeptidase family protein [Rufibacter radiotolerans]AKQ44874.1 hypothetical protein TH63_03345 [Rufibacter radiotolerans]
MKYLIKSVLFCVAFTGIFVVFSFVKGFIPATYERVAHGVIGILAAFLTTVIFLKIDRKQFSTIGLTFDRKTIPNFFTGVVIGLALMGLLAAGVLFFSHVKLEANPKSDLLNFLLMTLPLLPLAFMEELGFRAYPLEILKDRIGTRWAILITSILFALYHIANGWSVASSFYGPAIWGLIFGLAAVYSKGISMPTGIHYAANLTTSAFGDATSTVSIWTVKQTQAATTNSPDLDWATILPAVALLVLALVGMELFLKRTTSASMAFRNGSNRR